MDNTIFAQSVTNVRTLENKMLDRTKLEALIQVGSFSDAIRLLQQSVYAPYVYDSSYESGLKTYLEKFYNELYKIVPVKDIVDVLAIRYDGHNLKAALKGKFSSRSFENLLIDAGTIPASSIVAMVRDESYRDLPKVLKVAVEKATSDFKNNKDPQGLDITLDKAMYAYMLEKAQSSGYSYMTDVVKLLIDITNIKSFIRINIQDRGREFFSRVAIPGGNLDLDIMASSIGEAIENFPSRIYHTDYYGWVNEAVEEYHKTGNIGCIEKSADDYLMKVMKRAKLISFGPEPIVSYIYAVENEVRLVRIILTGKMNELSSELLRERLRDVYV